MSPLEQKQQQDRDEMYAAYERGRNAFKSGTPRGDAPNIPHVHRWAKGWDDGKHYQETARVHQAGAMRDGLQLCVICGRELGREGFLAWPEGKPVTVCVSVGVTGFEAGEESGIQHCKPGDSAE